MIEGEIRASRAASTEVARAVITGNECLAIDRPVLARVPHALSTTQSTLFFLDANPKGMHPLLEEQKLYVIQLRRLKVLQPELSPCRSRSGITPEPRTHTALRELEWLNVLVIPALQLSPPLVLLC
jgi:hypothetical protein